MRSGGGGSDEKGVGEVGGIAEGNVVETGVDEEEKKEEGGITEVEEEGAKEGIGIEVVEGIFINEEDEEDEEQDVEYVSASSSLLNRSNALLKSYPLINKTTNNAWITKMEIKKIVVIRDEKIEKLF